MIEREDEFDCVRGGGMIARAGFASADAVSFAHPASSCVSLEA